ncbi:MAG: T9SS type A sorting domain-containing protein, partial [Saprospiraceae bacterium]
FSNIDGQLPGYVPGEKPHILSNGIGQRLKKGSDLKLQVHYAPTSVDEWDSTTVNLYFAKKPVKRYLKSKVMLPFGNVLTNGPFVIQANIAKEFHGVYTFAENVSMLGISPHMHKLGKHWKVYAVKPNKDTVKLISIKDWDFNWQGTYYFKSPIILPKGTVVHAFAKYDNTKANINNPNNPPKMITWGEGTSDEMYYLPLTWVSYQAGDENIVFESGSTAVADPNAWVIGTTLYPVSPNPASSTVKLSFSLAIDSKIDINLFNTNGQLIKTIVKNRLHEQGLHNLDIDITGEKEGLYYVTLLAHGRNFTQKLMIKN